MESPERLQLGPNRIIAYHRTRARGEGMAKPGVVFLGGFGSDMTGTKATWLEGWARARGRAFLRFDYTGHGASSGRLDEGCIGDWADDSAEVLDRLTDGPQLLVGSSMGGWIALLLARARPERAAAVLGIAAAPDFTEALIVPALGSEGLAALMAEGRVLQPNQYGPEPRVITRRLIEDGRAQAVLDRPLRLGSPLVLVHGTADADVPASLALRLLDHVEAPQARLTLIKGGDHRLSDPEALAVIGAALAVLF